MRKTAEAALREAFGYDAWVLAYDIDTVAAISENYPFEREVPDTTPTSRSCPTPTCSTSWPL